METFLLHLLPHIPHHLQRIQLHIELHLGHFNLLNHLRFLHILPFFRHMRDKIMAFSIIPVLLIPVQS